MKSMTSNLTTKLLAVAALASAPSAFAIEGLAGFGVHGGVNFSQIDTNQPKLTANKDNINGMVLGLHGEFGAAAVIIRPELNFRTQGYDYANIATVKSKYLDIPILVKVGWMTGPVQIFAEAGPQFTLTLSNGVDVNGSQVNYSPDTKHWDFSGVAGAGIGFGLGDTFSLDLEGRYVFGFVNQNSTDGVTTKTRGWQALVGLTFKK